MSDVTLSREQITIAASDTLEDLLNALRATTSAEVVVVVAEHSPLLISLQQLHQFEEVAQAHGIQAAIASTNSKLLNAAKVFGLEVVDLRAHELPAEPGQHRLLAGQPLGQLAPAPQERFVARNLPAHQPVLPDEPDELPESAADLDLEEDEDAAIPVSASTAQRLDPYGQPYEDTLDDLDDQESDDAEDWDDANLDHIQPEQEQRRGFAGFWHDVQAWVSARRTPVAAAEFDEAAPEFVEHYDETGWDEPPYQQRHTAQTAILPDESADQDEDSAVDEAQIADEELPPIIQLHQPATRGQRRPAREQTARLPALTPVIAYDPTFEDDDEAAASAAWQTAPARPGVGRFALGSLLFTLLAIGLVLTVVLYLLLPTATVTLTARTSQVATDFRVVVGEIDPQSPAGQPTATQIVVPARRLTVPLNATATKPATGARLEPDVTAGGVVVLTNPSTKAVAVAKGTKLEATDGRIYVTTEEITVAAADPFGAEAFGSAPVQVAATIRGSGGNAPVGAVRGQLASGIYYTNKTVPIAGGSDRRITTIAPQDRTAAQAAAEDAVRSKGAAALKAAIPAGSTLMHDTNGVGNVKVQFNMAEGADGDNVTATVTAEVTGLVYQQADVEAQSRQVAAQRLTAQAKPGEPIVPGSMQINAPQVVEDLPGRLTYMVTGIAQTRAVIGSESERQKLAQDLANKDDTDAHAVLAAIPGVGSSTIQYQTAPFPERMPWLPSHIRIEVTDAR